jgi:hypothetical protein
VTAYEKVLFALEDGSASAIEDFSEWAHGASDSDRVDRAEFECLDEDAHRAHTRKPVRFFAFASFWTEPQRADDLTTTAPRRCQWFRVRERLAFDRSARPDEAEQLLAVDTMGFVDAARAHPTVTRHEVLRIGHPRVGTGGFI